MRRIQRQILRAQGRMVRYRRVLRSWTPSIVGSEARPSTPGYGWRFTRKSLGVTGKQEMRGKRASRREARELMESGGGM